MAAENTGLLLAFSAGLLSFLSPCVLPLVPGYLSLLTGLSLTGMQEGDGVWRRTLPPVLAFCLGFSFIFVSLGATASVFGNWLSDHLALLSRLGGLMLLLLGLFLLGALPWKILYRDIRFHSQATVSGLGGAFLAGAAFAFGWTPCVGPVLGAVLMMAGAADTAARGVLLLSAYSLGLALPLILSGLLLGAFLGLSRQVRKYQRLLTVFSGGLLVVLGMLLLLGWFDRLGQLLLMLNPVRI